MNPECFRCNVSSLRQSNIGITINLRVHVTDEEKAKEVTSFDILRVAAEYKEKIPDYIYKKLLEVEVKPY